MYVEGWPFTNLPTEAVLLPQYGGGHMLILDVCHLGIHARLHTSSRPFPERGWLILQTDTWRNSNRYLTRADSTSVSHSHIHHSPTTPPRKGHTPLESKRRHHINGHPTQVNHLFSTVLLRLNEKEKKHTLWWITRMAASYKGHQKRPSPQHLSHLQIWLCNGCTT